MELDDTIDRLQPRNARPSVDMPTREDLAGLRPPGLRLEEDPRLRIGAAGGLARRRTEARIRDIGGPNRLGQQRDTGQHEGDGQQGSEPALSSSVWSQRNPVPPPLVRSDGSPVGCRGRPPTPTAGTRRNSTDRDGSVGTRATASYALRRWPIGRRRPAGATSTGCPRSLPRRPARPRCRRRAGRARPARCRSVREGASARARARWPGAAP